jgi:hypothetical protein
VVSADLGRVVGETMVGDPGAVEGELAQNVGVLYGWALAGGRCPRALLR